MTATHAYNPAQSSQTPTVENRAEWLSTKVRNQIFEASGCANLRREALMCSYTSFLERTLEDPVKIWLIILSTVVVYLYYHYLRVTAEDIEHAAFSEVWLSKPIICTLLYLGIIKFARLMQQGRKTVSGAFEIIAVYNMCQTVFNAVMFWQFFSEVSRDGKLTWWGNTMETTKNHRILSFLIWVHYNNKYIELLDTCFVIIRKRWSQMSVLHVVMRILLLWSWYFVCRYGCGGDAYFGAMMHSFTQIFTYSYYCVVLVYAPRHHTSSGFKRELFRRLLLRLHIVQFYVGAVHATYILCYVDYNPWLAAWQLVVMLTFVVLFTDFHYQKHDPPLVERPKEPRIVFSFDSSGWLFVYHFGVAKYIEQHLRKDQKKIVAYSGSSGGALVAATLCCNIDIGELFEWILNARDRCALRPAETARTAEMACVKFMPVEIPQKAAMDLKVLATRVSLRRPPFFMGEILQEFESTEHLREALVASSNVPFIFGLFPKRVKNSKGGYGFYYDGMFWSQTFGFVPWRGFTSDDEIFRLSTISRMNHDWMVLPPMWAIFPPAIPVLKGLYAVGYIEAHRQFADREEFIKPEPISKEMLAQAELFYAALKAWWRVAGQISLALAVCISAMCYAW